MEVELSYAKNISWARIFLLHRLLLHKYEATLQQNVMSPQTLYLTRGTSGTCSLTEPPAAPTTRIGQAKSASAADLCSHQRPAAAAETQDHESGASKMWQGVWWAEGSNGGSENMNTCIMCIHTMGVVF